MRTRDAPGGLPGRGHLRPPAARGERAGPARADRRRPAPAAATGRARARPSGAGVSAPAFALPTGSRLTEPPEARGLARDEVRLLVATRGDGRIAHASFRDLPELLDAGRPAGGQQLRDPAGGGRGRGAATARSSSCASRPGARPRSGRVVGGRTPVRPTAGPMTARDRGRRGGWSSRAGRTRDLVAPYGRRTAAVARLGARRRAACTSTSWRYGRPIQYSYVGDDWPLDAFQTVYAREPGQRRDAERRRARSRPSSITALAARGVLVAPLTLHTGLSSPERHEPPQAERFEVPATTADAVNATRAWGGRVIAVGTTVARALETVAEPDGTVRGGDGWTNLVITPGARATVDRRPAQRLARARRLASAPAGGGRRRHRAARTQLRRRARVRLPLARVRRQPPDRALI